MEELLIRSIQLNWSAVPTESYLHQIESVRQVDQLNVTSPVTFFVGENGSGKSTLLEAIALAYGFNPEGGSLNYRFSTYDSHSELGDHVTLVKGPTKGKWGYFLRAESFYNVASQEENYFGSRSAAYHRQSHGEAFLEVLAQHCQRRGVYLLDEPESALSPQRQLALLRIIHEGVRSGGQFIIATHSPILLTYPGAKILCFDQEGIRPISYQETDSYQLTKLVMDNPKEVLHHLLEE